LIEPSPTLAASKKPAWAQLTSRLQWRKPDKLNLQQLDPEYLREWLRDSGSLTARLIAESKGQFKVEVLFQGLGRMRFDERRTLAVNNKTHKHQVSLIREVVLYGNNQPWVFARSVLPLSSLTGRLRQLRKISSKPLGAFLFKQPDLKRGKIEIANMNAGHRYLPDVLIQDKKVWGRRSVFYVDHKPLLVSEVFLPDFVSHISTREE
jgi:chorismate lyase